MRFLELLKQKFWEALFDLGLPLLGFVILSLIIIILADQFYRLYVG